MCLDTAIFSYFCGGFLLPSARTSNNAEQLLKMSQFPPPRIQGQTHVWSIGERIGSGGFGKVFWAESNDYKAHVAKFTEKTPGAEREIRFADLPDLKNIVPVIDSGETAGHWFIVMPKADMSLDSLLKDHDRIPTASTARKILEDLAIALKSMRGRVVHRDIKPDNILLLNGNWCLADFGISKYADATTSVNTRKLAWTPQYAAPEQWRHERATSATDVYAFGVVACELFSGMLPFRGPEIEHFRQQHLHDSPELSKSIPPEIASLVGNCLMKSPDARPKPKIILDRLRLDQRPNSDAEAQLQQANARVVRQRQEVDSRRSAQRTKEERDQELFESARQSFNEIISTLGQRIMQLAPDCIEHSNPIQEWVFKLGNASLGIGRVKWYGKAVNWDDIDRRIMAYSEIELCRPPNREGHKGISHSLWFFRNSDNDGFRWYELAFTIPNSSGLKSSLDPFSIPPGEDAGLAISRGVVHSYDIEQYPTPIDQGDEEDFIDRWIGRLAEYVP